MSGALKNDEILWTKPFILTLLASFLIFIPYSLYLPILPIYVLDELHGSFAAAGMVNAIFLFASVLFRSQTGRLETRFGIRVILLASGCMFLLSNSLFLLTDSTVMVVIIRFFSGACFAIVNTSIQAVGSRIAPLKRKGEGLGYLTMVITAGCAIGPYTGLKLARAYGFAWVFVFSTVVVLVGFIFSTFIPIEEQKTDRECHPARIKLKDLIEMRAIPASSIALLLSFAYAAVISFVTVYANQIQLSVAAAYFFVVLVNCPLCF